MVCQVGSFVSGLSGRQLLVYSSVGEDLYTARASVQICTRPGPPSRFVHGQGLRPDTLLSFPVSPSRADPWSVELDSELITYSRAGMWAQTTERETAIAFWGFAYK